LIGENDDRAVRGEEEALPFDEALRRLLAAKPKPKKAEEKPPPTEQQTEPEK
jgi:hypothetical protein